MTQSRKQQQNTAALELNARDASKLLALLENTPVENHGEGFDVKPIALVHVKETLGNDWKARLDSSGAFLAQAHPPGTEKHVIYLDPAVLATIEQQPVRPWEACKLADHPDKHVGDNPVQVVHQGDKVFNLRNFTPTYLETVLGNRWQARLNSSHVYYETATDAPVAGEVYEVDTGALSGIAQEYRLRQEHLNRTKKRPADRAASRSHSRG